MDGYKRILTIQDISCVGQCSLTVALPILSACGVETAILPSAVLSTHTAGFSGFTFRDLTDDIPAIMRHWEKEGLYFDAVYTGYLGSIRQIGYVQAMIGSRLKEGGLAVIDPAMGDNGKLYSAFDTEYVEEMKKLIAVADITLPNVTEACFLTGAEYREEYDEGYIRRLTDGLLALGAKSVVLTGIGYEKTTTGVVVADRKGFSYYKHKKIDRGCHGTGDVYASAFCGALLRGKSAFDAAKIAADFTVRCIENTLEDKNHWYGVKFETALPELIGKVSARRTEE